MKLKRKIFIIIFFLLVIFLKYKLNTNVITKSIKGEIENSNINVEVSSYYQEKEITAENNWEYTFSLPKYSATGELIKYEVDEKDVPTGYVKSINGTTITNTLQDLTYTVEYYYDGIKDESVTENLTATYNSLISTYVEKNKYGYEFSNVEGLNFNLTEAGNVIKVYYRLKDSEIIVRYVDKVTGEYIATPASIVGKVFDTYKTSAKEIKNYTLVETTDNTSGTMTEDTIIVDYKYLYNSNIKIKYIDKYSNEVIDTDIIYGLEGEIKTTSEKDIDGYTLIEKPKNEEYRIIKDSQEVIYYYAKNTYVIVKYLEKDTNEVLETEIKLEGSEGKEYNTEEKNIDGYTLSNIFGEKSGLMSREKTTVIYYYLQNTSLTVKYIDKYTGNVLDTVTKNGLVDDMIITESKNINGYTLVEKPEIEEYILTKEPIEVKYYYANNIKVQITHYDKATDEILHKQVINTYNGADYNSQIELKKFPGYVEVEEKSNIDVNGNIQIDYYYLYETTLKVNHIDLNSGEILELEEIKGLETESKTLSSKYFEGYKLVDPKPENELIKLEKINEPINYYYVHISQGVIVKYIDKATDKLLGDELLIEGYEGDAYTTEQKIFDNYTFIESTDNMQGIMINKLIEVKYYYLYNSKVTVNYIDKFSEEIIKTENISGLEGNDYKIEYEPVDSYQIDESKLPENEEGKFTKEPIIVNYYLISKSAGVIVKYIDKATGEELVDSVIFEGYEGDNYTSDKKEIKDFTFVSITGNPVGKMTKDRQNVIYEYLKNTKVIINHFDLITGNRLKQEEITGLETLEYKVNPKDFDNYDLVKESIPENEEGKFTKGPIIVNYYYVYKSKLKVNYINKENNVILDQNIINGYEGDSGKTEVKRINYHKLVKKPEIEEYTLTKEEQEKNYYYRPLKFNISISQSLENIDLNGNVINSVGKLEISRKEIVNSLKLKYKISVSNFSELDGSTILYDYIPNGYVALQDDNSEWKIEGDLAYINVENLKVGEKRDFYIVLTAKSTNVVGNIINKSIAKNSTNEAGFEETNLNDNEAKTDFIISISTGLENNIQRKLFVVLILLVSIAVILMIVKRYVKKI